MRTWIDLDRLIDERIKAQDEGAAPEIINSLSNEITALERELNEFYETNKAWIEGRIS